MQLLGYLDPVSTFKQVRKNDDAMTVIRRILGTRGRTADLL